ncbi:MAG: cupin-like domain-containing protein [Sphingomonas sp.]
MTTLPPVKTYPSMDRARFEAEVVPAAQPAVFRGAVAGWPVVVAGRAGPAALAAYLRGHANDVAGEAWFGAPEIAGRFGFNTAVDGYNHERKAATIAQLLDLLLRQEGDPHPWSIFAGALPLRRHMPGFVADNAQPLLDEARQMLVSLWLGNGTSTAAHWDLPQNLACVVAGRRRFTLFPTEQVANLYVGPLDFTLAGQPSSLVDVDAPDFDRFPKFREALAHAQVAELDPGDVLYLPSLWWHAVRSEGPVCAMINYWWRDAPADAISPIKALTLAVMTLRDTAPEERARWRHFFDHYIFGDSAPVEHIPAAARGILGERDAAAMAAAKAMIARSLVR